MIPLAPPAIESLDVHPFVWRIIGAIIAALLVGTLVRWLALRGRPAELVQKRMSSLRTWWGIALLFCASLLFGRLGGTLFFAMVSLLALRELIALTRKTYDAWGLKRLAYLLTIGHYVALGVGADQIFSVLVPVGGLLLIAGRMVVCDRGSGFLLTASSLYWGMMLTVFALSHAARLWTLPPTSNPVAGNVGWFLYLILLTEFSDITQALVGRRFGRRPISPVLSPHKTWEGLLAGIAFTTCLAVVLAPWLTPLAWLAIPIGANALSVPYLPAVLAGLLISVSGYFGDLTISGVKRDVDVKDSGTMLPGQGGLLDRVDSLMFAAPVFYYYLCVILPK